MQFSYRFLAMLRRHVSPSPSPRVHKRAKLDHLTKEDFKNGVFLAPMVRSGACKWNDLRLNVYPGTNTLDNSANSSFRSQTWCYFSLGSRDC